MSDDAGGRTTSAVPVGIVGTSAVAGAEPDRTAGDSVVATTAGAWITPIVAGGLTPGSRSSSDLENPYASSAPATITPAVTASRVRRDRERASMDSTTTPTLPR